MYKIQLSLRKKTYKATVRMGNKGNQRHRKPVVPRAIENIKQMPASNQINIHTQTNTNII